MTVRSGILVALVVTLLSGLSVGASDSSTEFLQTHYYLLPLGQVAADVDAVCRAAQSSGFSVISYSADSAEAYRGDDPVSTAPTALLSDRSLLVIDGDRFLLRQPGEGFTFSVRPSEEGYELVIDPQQDLVMSDVLGPVLTSLQSMGIVGDEVSLNVQAFAKEDLKGPTPPSGIPIESTLYHLLIARDWFDFAATRALSVVGLRVEVVAEILPGAALDPAYTAYVVEEGQGLAKLLLPIDRLLALARSSAVGYVRSPYRPSVP